LLILKKIDQFPQKKYFGNLIDDFSKFDEIKKNWIFAQDKINLDKKVKIFKTHQGKYTVEGDSFTDNNNTLATIYIVRDPRNVLKSISNHYTLSISDSLKFMMSPKIIGNGKDFKNDPHGIYTLLGSWDEHYRSWTTNRNNLLLVKYEDLILDPKKELKRIFLFLKNFIDFETNEEKNKKIIETTSFENLKKMETKDLFKEGVLNKETKSKVNFFNLGPKNKWQGKINNEIVGIIEKKFGKEMLELNYLDKN